MPDPLDPSARAPLHSQLAARLRELITGEKLLPGDPLPTESELQAQYGVSRSVARQAMLTLASEGLVVRGRGRGTTVAAQHPHLRLAHRAEGLAVQAQERGVRIRTHILSFSELTDLPAAAAPLGQGPVWELDRLRASEKNVPLAVIRTWIRAEHAAHFDAPMLEDASLHERFRERLGLVATGGRRQVQAVAADERLATLLGVTRGAPLLQLHGTTLDQDGRAFEVFTTWHRGDRIAFELDVENGPAPAAHQKTDEDPLTLARRLVEALSGGEDPSR